MAIEALGTELNYNGWTREYVLVVFGVIPLTTLLVWNIWVYLSSPVRKYPGPFLASKIDPPPPNDFCVYAGVLDR